MRELKTTTEERADNESFMVLMDGEMVEEKEMEYCSFDLYLILFEC